MNKNSETLEGIIKAIRENCNKYSFEFDTDYNIDGYSKETKNLFEMLKSEGKINKDINIIITNTPDAKVLFLSFTYNNRRLIIESIEDIVNFNPFDYYYYDDGIVKHCSGAYKLEISLEGDKE